MGERDTGGATSIGESKRRSLIYTLPFFLFVIFLCFSLRFPADVARFPRPSYIALLPRRFETTRKTEVACSRRGTAYITVRYSVSLGTAKGKVCSGCVAPASGV